MVSEEVEVVSDRTSDDRSSERTVKRLVKQKLLVKLKTAVLCQASSIKTCGIILPDVPMERRLCANCTTRSMRTMGPLVMFEIIYSMIIRININ